MIGALDSDFPDEEEEEELLTLEPFAALSETRDDDGIKQQKMAEKKPIVTSLGFLAEEKKN